MKAAAFIDHVAIMSEAKVTIKEAAISAKILAVDDLQKDHDNILID